MTKEELKQEAKESFEQYKVTDEDYVVSPYSDDMGEKMLMYNDEYYAEETYLRLYKQGYLAGAEPREKRIAELEAEVKEWKDKADLWCKTANLKDHNIMINKELKKENAELNSENQKWKDEWQEQVQKATDEGYARTLQTIQLTKAKDHIKKLLDCLKQDTNDPQTNYYVCQYMDKAEQFLSEVEK